MLSKIRNWWTRNDVEISWAIIGSLATFGICDLAQGYYVSAMFSFLFAYLNYLFRAVR